MTTQADFDPKVLAPERWHGWTLNPDTYCLVWRGGRSLPPECTVVLEDMRTAGRMVHTIFQIVHRDTAELAIAGLFRALDELLDPQKLYAEEERIHGETVLALVSEYLSPTKRR